MNFNAIPVGACCELRRDPCLAIQHKRLLDVERVDLYRVDGQAKGLPAGGQRHLGETRRRHDGLAMHPAVGQPR